MITTSASSKPGQRVVARLQADRAERARVLVVEQALAHERLGDADPGRARELAQRRRARRRARRRCRRARSGARRRGSRSAASSSSPPLGSGRRTRSCAGSGSASTVSAITSSGSSMCVGPGFCACATLNALRTTSGITREEFRRAFHFVIGWNIETTSMCWWDSLCIRSRSACPVSATSGERSRNASATAGDQVRRARAERAEADAGAPRQAAVHVGHVGAALLVANRHERDRGVARATR